MDKRANTALDHVIQRAYERHRLKLTRSDVEAVARTCAGGTGMVHRWESSGRERHLINLYGKVVSVIYLPEPTLPNDAHFGLVLTIEPNTEDASMSLAYTMVKNDPPRDMRTVAQITCVRCGAKGKTAVGGFGNNPEKINQAFIRMGWDADVWNPSKNWCPKCVKQRQEQVQRDLGIDKLVSTANEIVATDAAPPPSVGRIAPPAASFSLGAGTRTAPKGDEPVTDMKKLTPKAKGLLRTALESYFDPDTGRYEKDWSDHRISEELQIARRVVADFRDMMYGEIQEDPEIAALHQMIEEAKRVMGNLQASLQRIDDKADALIKKHGGK